MEINCQHYGESYSLYLENELAGDQKKQFEHHLNSCPACQKAVSQLKIIRNSLHSIPNIQASKDFETILRARIQMTKNIGRGQWAEFFDRFKLPAYAVSMTAIFATILYLHLNTHTPDRAPANSPTENLQTTMSETDIKPGDVVYAVDILTQSEESRLIKVSENSMSGITRSMIIARKFSRNDTIANRLNLSGIFHEESIPVSF
jgi:hypothetical protein